MMEDLITVAIGVYQQAMLVVPFDLVQHPNEWSYSCPKCDYDVVLFQFSWGYLSWQYPSLSNLPLASVQIMTAQAAIQSSFGYLILHQFNKQINVPSLHPSNRILPAYYLIDILNKIPEIQLQLKIPDKLYDISLVLLDEIEVLLVTLLEFLKLLPEEWIWGGVYKGWGGFVDEEVVIDDEAKVEMGGEELVEGQEGAVVSQGFCAGFGEVVEHEGYIFLSVLREDLDDVSLFYEFFGGEELQLGPVCPSVLVRGQLLHFLNPKLHFLVPIPQTKPTFNFTTIFLNDSLLLDKTTHLVSPTIQVHFPISLSIHIIPQPNLNKLLASQHLQPLPQLPRSHTEVLTVRTIPKRIDRKFYGIVECVTLLHEFFPEGPHVVGRTALAGGRDEEDPNASVQGKMAVELLN